MLSEASASLNTASADGVAGHTSHVRFRVVGMCVLLAMITYLDRAVMSTLMPGIAADLSLDKQQQGWVFFAFALAYAMFEIPTSWWADRIGSQRILARIVAWWSFFTLATAFAFNYASLLVARFLFGAGEAGAWPCSARAMSRWVPRNERGTVQGVFFAGALLAGGLTPLIATAMLSAMSWRSVLLVFGGVGFVWAIVWRVWFRDEPRDKPEVSPTELAYITAGRVPETPHGGGWAYWRSLFGDRNVLALCVMYFPNSFSYIFTITFLPQYLREYHGFTDAGTIAFFTGLPLLMSVPGVLVGGIVTDLLSRKFGHRAGRCILGTVGYGLAAVTLLTGVFSGHPVFAATMIAVSLGATMFTLAAAWSVAVEVGGQHSGVVSAMMNTSGQVGAMLSPLIVGYGLKWFASWNLVLYLTAASLFMGAVAWLVIDPTRVVRPPAGPEGGDAAD